MLSPLEGALMRKEVGDAIQKAVSWSGFEPESPEQDWWATVGPIKRHSTHQMTPTERGALSKKLPWNGVEGAPIYGLWSCSF